MNITKKSYHLFVILLILSFSIRVCLFYTYWRNAQHGSAGEYGSAAIGLFYSEGLTINKSEQKKINKVANNFSGNYLSFHIAENRQNFTGFLPGPSILLYLLWKVLNVYNFSPYIWLQIFLESFLISFVYFALRKIHKSIALATTIFMMINPVTIKYTLTMGYDFWPQFCVLVNFIGITLSLQRKKFEYILFFTGMLAGITIWFRSITSILPFYIAIFLVFYFRLKDKWKYTRIGFCIALYLFPVIFSMVTLSVYRYELTGNYRPTRSTFWHSFWAGVGQFPNPYGLKSIDEAIWKFGQRLNPKLADLNVKEMAEMGAIPDSLYEKTLKNEAFLFIRKYPHLIVRNTIYRIVIMIAPVLYKDGTFIPDRLLSYLFPLGGALIVIWLLGMYSLLKFNRPLFGLSLIIYIYFFTTFGVFYVVGRAILPFLFVNIMVYLFGIEFSIQTILQSEKMSLKAADPDRK
jgi:hypothetical protein